MIQDFTFALRQLRKSPGFTLAAVVVLALGIGANTAVFSLIHTMIFQPRSFVRPAEVVQLYSQDKKNPKSFRIFSYPTYRDIREQNTVFTDVLAHNSAMVGVGEKGNTRRSFASVVTSNYFSVLGVMPAHGRAFLPEEETPGKPAQVAIVSDNFWKKHGRNLGMLGSEIIINGRPFTVVGIMPKGFSGTMHIFGSEIWMPMSVQELVSNDFEGIDERGALNDRAGRNLFLLGRLKPGITIDAAAPEIKGIAANLGAGLSGRAKGSDLHPRSAAAVRDQLESER